MGLSITLRATALQCDSHRTSHATRHTAPVTRHTSRAPLLQAGSATVSFFVAGAPGCSGVIVYPFPRAHALLWHNCLTPTLTMRSSQAIVAAVELTQEFPGGSGSVIDAEVSMFALRGCSPGEYARQSPAICVACPAGSFTLEVECSNMCLSLNSAHRSFCAGSFALHAMSYGGTLRRQE